MGSGGRRMAIEVVYATPQEQVLLRVEVAEGATAGDAIAGCGILRRFPELETGRIQVGIFGRVTGPDALLRDGDRVEIYRPLLADPKDARRARARQRR